MEETCKGDVNTVASLLKNYLDGWENPLLTYELFDDFVATLSIDSISTRLEKIKEIISALDEERRNILEKLLQLLVKIAAKSDLNSMPATNLAKIFGPIIMKKKTESLHEQLFNLPFGEAIVIFLVQQGPDRLFTKEQPKSIPKEERKRNERKISPKPNNGENEAAPAQPKRRQTVATSSPEESHSENGNLLKMTSPPKKRGKLSKKQKETSQKVAETPNQIDSVPQKQPSDGEEAEQQDDVERAQTTAEQINPKSVLSNPKLPGDRRQYIKVLPSSLLSVQLKKTTPAQPAGATENKQNNELLHRLKLKADQLEKQIQDNTDAQNVGPTVPERNERIQQVQQTTSTQEQEELQQKDLQVEQQDIQIVQQPQIEDFVQHEQEQSQQQDLQKQSSQQDLQEQTDKEDRSKTKNKKNTKQESTSQEAKKSDEAAAIEKDVKRPKKAKKLSKSAESETEQSKQSKTPKKKLSSSTGTAPNLKSDMPHTVTKKSSKTKVKSSTLTIPVSENEWQDREVDVDKKFKKEIAESESSEQIKSRSKAQTTRAKTLKLSEESKNSKNQSRSLNVSTTTTTTEKPEAKKKLSSSNLKKSKKTSLKEIRTENMEESQNKETKETKQDPVIAIEKLNKQQQQQKQLHHLNKLLEQQKQLDQPPTDAEQNRHETNQVAVQNSLDNVLMYDSNLITSKRNGVILQPSTMNGDHSTMNGDQVTMNGDHARIENKEIPITINSKGSFSTTKASRRIDLAKLMAGIKHLKRSVNESNATQLFINFENDTQAQKVSDEGLKKKIFYSPEF